jgi:adenylate cyclase
MGHRLRRSGVRVFAGGSIFIAQRFAWPNSSERILIIASCIGFFLVLMPAWYNSERGAQRVTGMELLILALLLGIGGGFLWRFALTSPVSVAKSDLGPEVAIPETSIAVLPFDNLSEDKSNAYFAEGVQDETLTWLAKVADRKVILRVSTQHFKSSPENYSRDREAAFSPKPFARRCRCPVALNPAS